MLLLGLLHLKSNTTFRLKSSKKSVFVGSEEQRICLIQENESDS